MEAEKHRWAASTLMARAAQLTGSDGSFFRNGGGFGQSALVSQPLIDSLVSPYDTAALNAAMSLPAANTAPANQTTISAAAH
jgi:hypothetical protein